MYYLVYVSYTRHPWDEVALNELLHQSRVNNNERGITGLLIYSESKFIQVLEGEKEDVITLFDRIQSDTRHYKVSIIIEGTLKKRNYPDWTMAYKSISSDDLVKQLGFVDVRDYFFEHKITESSHVAEIFMKLFIDKNDKESIL